MDFEEIGNRLANLTMYDVKQLYTTAKNYALNVSEIEAKVNEATNDDPWGASSTLMQEIAQATHNFQDFNEIMPAIYRNFMEREAREWRQIYKSLQLLEYIVKHGSERVVDDARSHLSTIKILRNFHYIDEAGKDQGINVRNRAKEISELLSDIEHIRQERRKARANRTKYQGGGNSDFVPGSGTGRYGGFGSDSFYGGGGFNGAFGSATGSGGGRGSTARESFDAYDAGDDEDQVGSSRHTAPSRGASEAPPTSKKAEKVADLFSFDDDEPAQTGASQDALDDFDDFQAAPSAVQAPAQPLKAETKSQAGGNNVFDFLDDTDSKQASQNSINSATNTPASLLQPSRTTSSGAVPTQASGPPSTVNTSTATMNFDDLWASSSGKSATSESKGKMTMAEMAKQKSNSAVWGTNTSSSQQQNKPKDPFDFL